MATYQIEDIQRIVLKNPNKGLIDAGKEQANKLMLHIHGVGMSGALDRCEYFESLAIHKARKQYAISNKDLFARLLQQEDIIFSANGGSSYFSLSETEEAQMNALLDDVRYEMPLRKWMRNFGLQAYRSDPMGIIFMEVEQLVYQDGMPVNAPKTYPTYKSIYSIYDYLPNGRKLEYVCFRLTVSEALSFGIEDKDLVDRKGGENTEYFRFVDDQKDIIVKRVDDKVIIATNMQNNPVRNVWERCPAFILSDLVQFNNPQVFVSPLDFVVELADCFLNDRSIRDLQKKYHGFSKAVEPLQQCGTCLGTGFVGGKACHDCSERGAQKGSGYKRQTKVSDVSRFPLDMLKDAPGFDFKKIFGYVTPDIEGWNKQDLSLADLEQLINMTYWGTSREISQQLNKGKGEQKTAFEINSNNKPKEARLNMTADWAEKTESMIADFIGDFWFHNFKKSQIAYGRNWVLETPDELMVKYQEMRSKGAPEAALDDVLLKYYNALYQNNPVQRTICTKLMVLEPFVHLTIAQAEPLVESELDYIKKLYFGEWKRKSVTTDQLLSSDIDALDLLLEAYATKKYQQVGKDREAQMLRERQAASEMQGIRLGNSIKNANKVSQ
jgi:hypothetical protein